MPVPPEVQKKIREMRARLKETERLAGTRPVGRPPREESEQPAEPPAEPAHALATLDTDAARVNQVFQWIVQGATEHDILEAMRQAWPQTAHAPLLLAAIDKIRDSSQIDAVTVLGFCVEATRDMYRRMVEIGDFAGALRAVKQLRDLAVKHGHIQRD